VAKVLTQPANRAQAMDLVERNGLDRKAVRERQKDIVIARLSQTTEKACDLVDDTLTEGNAKDFAFAMQGLERLDKVSGNTVGEGMRIVHEGLPPSSPQIELRALILQVLGRPVDSSEITRG
jgi:hypothetical protein